MITKDTVDRIQDTGLGKSGYFLFFLTLSTVYCLLSTAQVSLYGQSPSASDKEEADAGPICLSEGPCCQEKNLQKRLECLGGERLKKTADPLSKEWVYANTALSDIYYAAMIDKNANPNVKNLWQNAFGLMYKAMDIMRKGSYSSQGIGGEGVDISTLLPYYTETQGQLRNALNQLYVTPGIASSLGGRGRRVFPQLELAYQELGKIRVASSRRDYAAYESGLDAFYRLSKVIWFSLSEFSPAKYSDVVKAFPAARKGLDSLVRAGLRYVGGITVVIFLSIFFFIRLRSLGLQGVIESAFSRLSFRAKNLTQEYNRQFVGVGAGWLLYGPMIISVIFGLVSMNIFVFLMAVFVFVYLLPTEGLKFIKERRRIRVEAQLLDALILLSDAMKSGLDLVQALELAVHELVPPVSEEFDLLLKNYKLGMSFEEALKSFDERVDSEMVGYVVRAIIIQRQTGGNLTKIFDRIVDTIREEGKLKDKVNALTAGPRIQSLVISVVPWAMLIILYFFQPQTVGAFYTSILGLIVILFSVFWQTIGQIVIRKMAKIEV
ncbi:MAG: type II secretion system F family protein [Elusimicrobia bacterium]|nr:type II secretion system F family protein [Elusimicrobiota bacterium]